MKILEICPFSSGIDGVFTRVWQESLLLTKAGHKVRIFSSDIVKGSNALAKSFEKNKGVEICRFPSKQNTLDKFISGNVTYFDFDGEFEKFKPDVVITHLPHPHSFKALKLCKKHRIKCYLVTHAPFGIKRGFFLGLATKVFYAINVKRKINQFDKIIAITRWEMPFLDKLGVSKNKIEYIPNGIPSEFFKLKKANNEEADRILFLGRVAPVKDIETLLCALPLIKDRKVILEIVGPAEKDYFIKLKKIVEDLGISNRVKFSSAIYDINEKIKKIDSARVFVLPSKREGMPQSLIEAMAREKIVVASDNFGARDIVSDGKNGYLFEIGNVSELVDKLNVALTERKEIRASARKSVEQFSWDKIIKKVENLIRL